MSDDEVHFKILAGVRSQIAEQSAIWGYGPVSDVKPTAKKAKCVILVDQNSIITLPPDVNIDVDGETWKIDIKDKKRKKYKINLHGPEFSRRDALKGGVAASVIAASGVIPAASNSIAIGPAPMPLTNTLMGGDAIFNTEYRDTASGADAIYWGTIAYISSGLGKIGVPGGAPQTVPTSCVSCAHVLYHKDGNAIKTEKHSSGFSAPVTLSGWPADWPASSPSGVTWHDLAASATTVAVSQGEVRGLGVLEGVAVPSYQDVLAKYGSSTGLTVGRDNGLLWRRLPDETGRFFLIRSVAMQFSSPGDSGAAVVFAGHTASNNYRKLAGFVLAGSTADDEQFYLPAQPLGGTPVSSQLSVVEISL